MASSPKRELPRAIGRYEVVRQLGAGAMGRVLLARDPVLERHVAIKILRDDLQIPSDVRDGLFVRMRHEARAAARVVHPNLVTIHDMGEDELLGLYLVFEWLEGQTLKQRLGEGRLSAREAGRMAKELGHALTFAHERGVLHRDVKPENIILAPNGTTLTDFGIARIPDSTLTHAGGLLGTPAYSAPETFREGKFSPASDQFSLAATLYEAISGERAFPGDDAVSVAARIAHEPPRRFAESLRYPEALDDALARGLAKVPHERFESCRDLGLAVLDALARREPSPAPALDRPSDPSQLGALASEPPVERPAWRVALGGLAVVAFFGLLARAVSSSDETTAPAASSSAQPSASSPTRPARVPATPPRAPRPPRSAPTTSASVSPPPSASPAPPSPSVTPSSVASPLTAAPR